MAYYAKAVALPLCLATCVGVAVWRAVRERVPWSVPAWSLGRTLAVTLLLTTPWIVLLSTRYHRFTINTASRAARALVGPENIEPYGHWEQVPEPGHIDLLETFDVPSVWSPFASVSNFKHQLKLFVRNGRSILGYLRELDYLSLGLTSALIVLILVVFQPMAWDENSWCYSLVPILALTSIYWLTFCQAPRYFWVLFPFILCLAFGLAEWLIQMKGLRRAPHYLMIGLVAVSFAFPACWQCLSFLRGRDASTEVTSHRDLARRLVASGLAGPMVGSNESMNRCSTYVAYFASQPCYGDPVHATVDQFRTSKAKLVIADRHEPIATALAADPHFRDLDKDLFTDPDEATRCKLKAFELLH